MKIAKQKAMTGVELVGSGAALTGGSILMEKMVESPPGPQFTGHDNIYAADSSPSFIKIESLAGQDHVSIGSYRLGAVQHYSNLTEYSCYLCHP